MRRLPIRTDLEGPKAAEIALHARSDVFSPSGRPLLERVFLFTVVRRNGAAKYGREIWRGRRTCSRATMRSHPLHCMIHPPSIDRRRRRQHQHVRRPTFWADATDYALPPDFTPHSSSSSSFRPRSGGRSRFAGERQRERERRGESGFGNSFRDY